MSDLLIMNPLDQDIDIIDDENVLDKIERMIMDSVEAKDIQSALHICKQVYNIALLSGKALARILYLIRYHWNEFEVNDDFYDTVTAYTGLSKRTVQTYPAVFSLQAENRIPAEYMEDIMSKNIKNLVPIAQTLDAGYELDDDDWKELVNASDFSAIGAKLREIKGKEPRSQALLLIMDRDGGIKAIKNNEQVYVGWLNVSEDNEIVQQAIERLKRTAGILEQ